MRQPPRGVQRDWRPQVSFSMRRGCESERGRGALVVKDERVLKAGGHRLRPDGDRESALSRRSPAVCE